MVDVTSAIIGGYRLVRRLGEGVRAEVLLGYPEHAPDAAPVAVKVYRPGTPGRSILTEAEALSRAEGEHVVRLLDVASDPLQTPALILERVQTGSLARLLRDRESLHAGEAITVLAPLAHSLARLHAAGVAHGALRPESVLFDADGAPVLACFGAASLFEPGQAAAALAAQKPVIADARAFTALACTVLERVIPDRAVRTLLSLRDMTYEPGELLSAWSEGLFDLATPAPIDLSERSSWEPLIPLRGPVAEPVQDTASDRAGILAAFALPGWLQHRVERYEPRIRELLARARDRLGSVRPRVWVPAAVVGVALVGAVAIVPPSPATPDLDTVGAPSVRAWPDPSAFEVPPIEDPAAAAVELLAERDRCLRELSVLCLDSVGQPGSAALAADQQLVRALQTGGELPAPWRISADQVTVIERLGDSALVSLGAVTESEPASLLLMQGEAGWRIRSYLER